MPMAWATTVSSLPAIHTDDGQAASDALNGFVARESRKLGLQAPCNEALTQLMKGHHYLPQIDANTSDVNEHGIRCLLPRDCPPRR